MKHSLLNPAEPALIRAGSAQPSAPGNDADGAGKLALRLRHWNILLAMEDIAEIIPAPRITRVPGVKSWLLGIANLRGTVITVVDLGAYLGVNPSPLSPLSRIVVVRSGEWRYGLLVDEVIGMRHFEPHNKTAIPTADVASLIPYIREAYAHDRQTWFEFNVGALLIDAKFLEAAS